jgi:hypothetical protein
MQGFSSACRQQVRNPLALHEAVHAISASVGIGAADPGNLWSGAPLGAIFARMADLSGVSADRRGNPGQLFAAMSTPDVFPEGLETFRRLVERALHDAYLNAARTWEPWTRQRLRPTFRDIAGRKRVIGFDLQSVSGGGAFSFADVASDDVEIADATTKAAVLRMTRQEFHNNDYSFIEMAAAAGRAAAIAVSNEAYGVLSDNPVLADSGQLFNSTAITDAGGHDNAAASGAAPAVATIQTAKASIRSKPARPGGLPLGIRPRFLIVPSKLEDTAWNALGTPSGLGEPGSGHERAMLDAGRMNLVVAPELDGSSATAWYVAADPASAPLVEVSFVGTQMLPRVRGVRINPDTDALEAAITFEFVATAANWRGGYRNPGA